MMCFYSTKQGKRRFLQDDFHGSIYECPHHGEEARTHKKDSDTFHTVVKRLAKTGLQTQEDYRDFNYVMARLKYAPLPKEENLWQTAWKNMPPSRTSLEDFLNYHLPESHDIRPFQGLMSPRIPDDIEHLEPEAYRHFLEHNRALGKDELPNLKMPYGLSRDAVYAKPAYPYGGKAIPLSNNAEEGKVYHSHIVKVQKAPNAKPSSSPSKEALKRRQEKDAAFGIVKESGNLLSAIQDSLKKDSDAHKRMGKASKVLGATSTIGGVVMDIQDGKTPKTIAKNVIRDAETMAAGELAERGTVSFLKTPVAKGILRLLHPAVRSTMILLGPKAARITGEALHNHFAPKVKQEYHSSKKPTQNPSRPPSKPISYEEFLKSYYLDKALKNGHTPMNDFMYGIFLELRRREEEHASSTNKQR